MFDWDRNIISWRDRMRHFLLCNNRVFPGCTGHFYRPFGGQGGRS